MNRRVAMDRRRPVRLRDNATLVLTPSAVDSFGKLLCGIKKSPVGQALLFPRLANGRGGSSDGIERHGVIVPTESDRIVIAGIHLPELGHAPAREPTIELRTSGSQYEIDTHIRIKTFPYFRSDSRDRRQDGWLANVELRGGLERWVNKVDSVHLLARDGWGNPVRSGSYDNGGTLEKEWGVSFTRLTPKDWLENRFEHHMFYNLDRNLATDKTGDMFTFDTLRNAAKQWADARNLKIQNIEIEPSQDRGPYDRHRVKAIIEDTGQD